MMIWRLLASVLVMSDQGRRQRQIMKHEQAMNDRKNKAEAGKRSMTDQELLISAKREVR
jgi:hypothetical protein